MHESSVKVNTVSIVKYHYVRPISGSEHPGLKGLELSNFIRQLDYLQSKYEFITAEDLVLAVKGEKQLSPDSCWLTFDDGFSDHYTFVLSELRRRNIQGSFFPPARAILERHLLNVHAIHFILASQNDERKLLQDVRAGCLSRGISNEDLEQLRREHTRKAGQVMKRFDNNEVREIKALLQFLLPEQIRDEIISLLLNQYVSVTRSQLADQIYMSEAEVVELVDAGMYVGSHGSGHVHLSRLNKWSQSQEINSSLSFLKSVGAKTEDWIMCYPFGDYNQDTLDILQESKCVVGLTTHVGAADLKQHRPLELPRFDTNDFPSK